MTVTVTKHYEDLCDMPRCICPLMVVAMFLKDDLLTTDGKPYITGIVQTVTEDASGGVDVVITYDDTTMPLDGPDPVVVSFGEGATVCDPDCLGECEWLSKVILMMAGASGVINRHYQLFAPTEPVDEGVFDVARIPFPTGYRLSDCRVSCYGYDINTTADFELKVGAQVVATGSGDLGQQLQLTLVNPLMAYDGLPILTITNVVNSVYPLSAIGLVLELIGVIEP